MIRRCVLQPDTALAPDGSESPIDVFWFPLDGSWFNDRSSGERGAFSSSVTGSSIVTADEWAQRSRLRLTTVRQRRLTARAMLRCLLSAYLHVEPRRIVLELGEAGKPAVAWPSTGIQFNVSHSEGLAVVAISQTVSVGVDVEARSELLSRQTLDRLCHTQVMSAAGGQARSDEERLRAWVCEEARRKATGIGWSGVPIGGEVTPGGVRNTRLFEETIVKRLFVPLPNHVASLAVAAREASTFPLVRQWQLTLEDVSAGILPLHAQRLVDGSSEVRSTAAVRSTTYC